MSKPKKFQSQKKKGSNLEQATKLIQELFYVSGNELNGKCGIVERNKIVNVHGARHEIDVFVKTDVGSKNESIFIFECKDWAKPVGTASVHILASKVINIGAKRGFLVARKITKDARALVAINPRLRYIRCLDDFDGLLTNSKLCFSMRDTLSLRVTLR
jgi:hypothetical protein